MMSLGSCCCCGGTRRVRNIIMLPRRGPDPGKGWGCMVCHLPSDGATYVACDACLKANLPPREVIAGYASEGRRLPIESLPFEPFDHLMELHPECD